MPRPHYGSIGAPASRCGVASSFGSYCSALRGRTIRVVAFRASHPAKPPSRQRRFVQRFLNGGPQNRIISDPLIPDPHHIRLPARPHNPDPLNTSSFRDIWPVRGFRELQCREFSSKIFRAQLANAVYDVTDSILRSRLWDVRGTPTQCRTRSFR